MRLPIAALGLVLSACYSSGEGISPPLDRIYFPVGLTTNCDARAGAPSDCQATRLYVANSDFDLQYNAGSVQVLNLERVRDILAVVYPESAPDGHADCTGEAGLANQTPAEKVLAPGPCSAVDLDKTGCLFDKVGIGAFASDVILTTNLDGTRKRLLLPVRGEASLHWIDLEEDGKLNCGQSADSSCNGEHRVGTDPTANTRNVKMPSEPYGIAVSDENDAIAITHQTRGEVSLFYQDVSEEGWEKAGPKLESVSPLSAAQAVAIAAVPKPKYVREQRRSWIDSGRRNTAGELSPDPFPPGFLVGYANLAQIDLVSFYADATSLPARPFMQGVASVPLRANASSTVSRGIAFDDTKRRACDERECLDDPASDQCQACANESVGVYVSNRSPASLFVGATNPGSDIPAFVDAMDLPIGASRVYRGKVLVDGKLETRIFVVCFEQRSVAIYDPKSNRVEGYITTGRGPHAMAFDFSEDPPRALAYVGHFTDSYVGVVQLDRSKPRTYGKIVLSLAQRVAPRASK